MNKLLIATAAVAFATVGTAGAADLPTKAPPMVAPPVVYSWTGCYLSGGIGYGMWNQDNDAFSTVPGAQFATSTQTAGGRGWLGRVGVGCDYQVGPSFVIGAFGDYDFENIHGNFQDINFGFVGNEKQSASWAAGGRVGYLPYPNLLTFISAGWTQARFDAVTLTDPFGLVPGNINFPSNTYNGWFIGGGTEYQLPFFQNLSWKTEYRFSEFKAADLAVTDCTGRVCVPAGFFEHNEKFVQTVTTSLVWRFNFGGPGVARY